MARCNCTTAVCMAHPNFWVCKTPGCENGPEAAPTALRDMSDSIDDMMRKYRARWAQIVAKLTEDSARWYLENYDIPEHKTPT